MRRRFQRARKPEEKELRRQAILKAARRLMDEVGSIDVGLNELARRSGVSKPNIYRYFESREEVLLHVWIDEARDFCDRLQEAFAGVAVGDAAATARAIAAAFAAQPRMAELMAIVAPVLERNLSVAAIVTGRRTLADLGLRIAMLLHGRLPALPLEECAWAASAIGTYVAGIWPTVHPGPAAAEALARPELASASPVFERDVPRFIEVLFAGLLRVPRPGA
jgi:TetR/AcrR family transcriptional regulator